MLAIPCMADCRYPFCHPCISPESLQPVESAPCTPQESLQLAQSASCTSLLFLQAAVHFPRFLAAGYTSAVHFPAFLAARRALRPISCRSLFSCKKSGEVHVKKPAERPFRRALPPFSCRQPCISPVSLHEFAPLQGFGGSARLRAGIEGKCTAVWPSPAQPAFGPLRAFPRPNRANEGEKWRRTAS